MTTEQVMMSKMNDEINESLVKTLKKNIHEAIDERHERMAEVQARIGKLMREKYRLEDEINDLELQLLDLDRDKA